MLNNLKNFYMKSNLKKMILIIALVVSPFIVNQVNAQPDTPGTGSSGGHSMGGGAPIGSGIALLLSLGAGYGIKKVYSHRKKEQ
jgi:hypothetical protein